MSFTLTIVECQERFFAVTFVFTSLHFSGEGWALLPGNPSWLVLSALVGRPLPGKSFVSGQTILAGPWGRGEVGPCCSTSWNAFLVYHGIGTSSFEQTDSELKTLPTFRRTSYAVVKML